MIIDKKLYFLDLGIIDYEAACEQQLFFYEKVLNNEFNGILLLLEHYPVVTIGSNSNTANLISSVKTLKQKKISLVRSNRGGDITFHGPGQIICYPIINLNHFQKDLGLYVYKLEQVVINVLKLYGINGGRVPKHRGVFIDNTKIASIGIKIKKWITLHGFSFNVNVDLSYFENIIACGLKQYSPVSLEKITGKKINMVAVKKQILREFSNIFKSEIEPYN